MMSWRKPWKWGQKPPVWIMNIFADALTYMGKNNEAIHFFDVSPMWTFCIAVMHTDNAERMGRLLRDAMGGMIMNSEVYFPTAPRQAVDGDLFA